MTVDYVRTVAAPHLVFIFLSTHTSYDMVGGGGEPVGGCDSVFMWKLNKWRSSENVNNFRTPNDNGYYDTDDDEDDESGDLFFCLFFFFATRSTVITLNPQQITMTRAPCLWGYRPKNPNVHITMSTPGTQIDYIFADHLLRLRSTNHRNDDNHKNPRHVFNQPQQQRSIVNSFAISI